MLEWLTKPVVIIKADDLHCSETISEEWRRFFDFVDNNKLCASVGIVGKSLESPIASTIQELKDRIKTVHWEFWNHGYTHNEFIHNDIQWNRC